MKTVIQLMSAVVVTLVALSPAGNVHAQVVTVPPRTPGVQVNTPWVNGNIPSTPWFNSPSIRQQLKLDERQYNQLNQGYSQAWNRYNQGVTQLGNDLTPDQREARIRDYYGSFHNDFDRRRNEVLNDPNLQQRYNQLYWQYQGYGAFNNPTVQEKLALNETQRQAFQRYNQDANQELRTLRQEYGTNRDAVAKQFAQWRNQTNQRIDSTLTPQQREAWTQMTGNPYEFNAEDYFGGQQTQPINP